MSHRNQPIPTIKLLTCNVNGISPVDNGHTFVEGIVRGANIAALQETKLKDSHHMSTFTYHIDHAIGHGKYFVAVNELNA
jgi:exonuclease III